MGNYSIPFNNCSEKSWEALQKGQLSDGTSVKSYMEDFDSKYSKNMSVASVSPNYNTDLIQIMFQNNSFTKSSAIEQINSSINSLKNKSFIEKLFTNASRRISLY